MDEAVATPQAREVAPTASAGLRSRRMTICDGRGGMLTLDLSQPDIHWLVDACRRLLENDGPLPPLRSGLLKVNAGGNTYMVRLATDPDDLILVHIVNLYEPAEHIELDKDLLHVVAGLVESTGERLKSRTS